MIKKIFFLFVGVSVLALWAVSTPEGAKANKYPDTHIPNCLGMTGTFSAENWPVNADNNPRQVRVYCYGDSNIIWPPDAPAGTPHTDGTVLGPALCRGSEAWVIPGQEFKLKNCSCPPYADGCFKVDIPQDLYNAPNSCQIATNIAGYCGSNNMSIDVDFGIGCKVIPTATPTTPPNVPTNTPSPTRVPTPTPGPNSTPTPTLACFPPPTVPNVQVECPFCP